MSGPDIFEKNLRVDHKFTDHSIKVEELSIGFLKKIPKIFWATKTLP